MKRNFLFIKSATESAVIPVDSFSHAEYTSDTTVTMYFDAKRGGKDATISVVLTVSSGKANDVVSRITNQITAGKADIMRYDASSTPGKFHTTDVTGITSITTTESPSITTGPAGATGPTGPTGAAGADGADGADGTNGTNGTNGADGQGLITGGTGGQILVKASATDYDLAYQDRILPLNSYSGRFQHTSSQDSHMIIAGGIYGTNYNFWSTLLGITTSGGGTVDTTTTSISRSNQYYGAARVPVTGKIKLDAIHRPSNSTSQSLPYYLQLWEFAADDTASFGYVTCTLRAVTAMTTGLTSHAKTESMTTTSSVAAGNYVFVTLAMDAQTISSTALQYMLIDLSIIT